MGISTLCCNSIETPIFLETFKMEIPGRVENNIFIECWIKLVHKLVPCRKQLCFLDILCCGWPVERAPEVSLLRGRWSRVHRRLHT